MAELIMVPEQAASPRITSASIVKLVPFFAREEGEEFIVGSSERATYISMPLIGLKAMWLLEEGASIGMVAAQLRRKDDEAIDIDDFVRTLIACDLVVAIDGRPLERSTEDEEQPGMQRFAWLRGEYVRWLVRRPALIVHGLVFLATIVLLWQYPRYIPTSANYLFHPWYTVNILAVVFTTWLFLFLHELGHLAAARAFGIDGRLSVSRRLYTPVVQCELAHSYRLPRSQRVIIYLAGMAVNLWSFFLALGLILWRGSALPPLLIAWLELVMVIQWYSTIWQFRFYMQTDMYYVIGDVFHAKNLMDDARLDLRNLVARLRLQPTDDRLRHLPAREQRIIRMYALCLLLGVGSAIATLVIYILPFVVTMLGGAITTLLQGPEAGIARLLDAFVVIFFLGLNISFLIFVTWRERLERVRRAYIKPAESGLGVT